MSAEVFFDTNVLVYLIDTAEPVKKKTAFDLVYPISEPVGTCISWQVVQEFLNVATNKLKPRLSRELTAQYLSELLVPLCTVWPTPVIFARALELQSKHKLHFYDSLIVAGALSAGCTTLYSEDLQAGRKFGDLTIINPFVKA